MDIPVAQLSQQQNDKLYQALQAYAASLQVNADRPEAMTQLGFYYSVQGRFREAEEAYQKAIQLDQRFSAAYVNLADLYARQNDEQQALAILKQGLTVLPEDPDLQHALGLSLVRARRYEEAMPALAKAAKLAPAKCPLCLCLCHRLTKYGQHQTRHYYTGTGLTTAPP